MSAVDPLAALAAQMASAQTAVADAALDLGAIAQILQAQLSLGDILEATVLPARGGQDLIEIAGQTVLAQLPPDVHPGETLLLQVTGFQGNQILVRNLGIQDPNNPVPTFSVEIPPEITGSGATSATLTTIVPNQSTVAQPPPPAAAAPAATAANAEPPIAPPREVFVAASVRPSQNEAPAQTGAPAVTTPPAPPSAPPVDVEARIVAARTAPAERIAQTVAQKNATQTPVARQAALSSSSVALNPAQQAAADRAAIQRAAMQRLPNAQRPVQSAPLTAAQQGKVAAVPPEILPKTQAFEDTLFARPVPVPTAAPARSAAAAVELDAPPVRILAALKIPATPLTLAAARLVSTASAQVTSALQNLENVLAQLPSPDARMNTLQTITSFLARLEPNNPQTFTAQITSFISNVVSGAETKIAQLLQAINPGAAGAAAEHASEAQALAGGPQQTGVAASPAHVPILAQARAVERQMAITHDLKSTLLSLIANPPAGSSPQLSQALNDTLTALTAVQFNTLLASQSDPRTIVMNIPIMFYAGGQAAQIRVSRDAPKLKQRIDGDNFHIAFVLDTAALGTVGIDLETVGRSVKVQVKTDRSSAVDRFKTTFPELTSRLEQLRYKIASMGAGMIGEPEPASPAIPEAKPLTQRSSQVDLQA